MQHVMQDVQDFPTFLELVKLGQIGLIKFQQDPITPATAILTAGRHDRPHILRHLFTETDAAEVEEIIFIAGYKSAVGQWTIENSPSHALDKLKQNYKMPADVP